VRDWGDPKHTHTHTPHTGTQKARVSNSTVGAKQRFSERALQVGLPGWKTEGRWHCTRPARQLTCVRPRRQLEDTGVGPVEPSYRAVCHWREREKETTGGTTKASMKACTCALRTVSRTIQRMPINERPPNGWNWGTTIDQRLCTQLSKRNLAKMSKRVCRWCTHVARRG
jgi:hypothetical protein